MPWALARALTAASRGSGRRMLTRAAFPFELERTSLQVGLAENGLLGELQATEILRGPAGLHLDVAAQGLGAEGVAGSMAGDRHATAVGMVVAPVTARPV